MDGDNSIIKNENNKKKLNFMVSAIVVIMICVIIIGAKQIWNDQYMHGVYRAPFCGEQDDSGLTLLGTLDGCDVYMYNLKDLTYGTWNGTRVLSQDVLQKDWACKESIFPTNGEDSIEVIGGIPVRINRYEALTTLDVGGAIVFMNYAEDYEEAYNELMGIYK